MLFASIRSEEESGSRRSRRSLPRRTPGIRRRRPLEVNDMESFSLLISEPSSDPGVLLHRRHHMAKSHDDTSAGAIHRYQDEHGKL
jgi:hypothetical protein